MDAATGTRGPFVVVGMGRSGTSYVSSVLHGAGVVMGRELKPADEHNERGYFEDLDALRMHQEWLERLGLSFVSLDDRFPLDPGDEGRARVDEFVRRRESELARWGLKAPGILFFWPAWRDALPPETVVLFPFRHPEGTLRSLERGGIGREQGLALWLQLNRLALQVADEGSFETVLLDFDDRRQMAERLSALLGPYVDPYELGLQHHGRGPLPEHPEVRELYGELKARAAAPDASARSGRSRASATGSDG